MRHDATAAGGQGQAGVLITALTRTNQASSPCIRLRACLDLGRGRVVMRDKGGTHTHTSPLLAIPEGEGGAGLEFRIALSVCSPRELWA